MQSRIRGTKSVALRGRFLDTLILCFAFPFATATGLESGVTELSLEELANTEVSSAAKKAQPLSKTAAAVYVISRDAIRRSGATSIPEVLRLAPGVNVSQLGSARWAVSIRGFNSSLSNKLLVLVDGRSVYDQSFFSGVFWETLAVPLEEIERIEVIRGPGGALWGANAVNGVINIITRKATDTLGGQVSVGAGDVEQGFGTLRYGISLGESAYGRAYVRALDRDAEETAKGLDADDGWRLLTGGYRVDWQPTPVDKLTFQGDSYDARLDRPPGTRPLLQPPFFVRGLPNQTHGHGFNSLARWTRAGEDGSELRVQVYYDEARRAELNYDFSTQTQDLDVQHRFRPSAHQELTWGFGYRDIESDIRGPQIFTDQENIRFSVKSAFLVDEFGFLDDRLTLSLGAKWEDHELVGHNVQPSARLNWVLSEAVSVWAAYSRAVRTPSRTELDISFLLAVAPTGLPAPRLSAFFLTGDPELDTEKLKAGELGLRWLASDSLSIDFTVFQHRYEDLVQFPLYAPVLDPQLGQFRSDFIYTNGAEATAEGAELALQWLPSEGWSLALSYSYLDISVDEAIVPTAARSIEEGTPQQQVSLHNRFELAPSWELNLWLRYRDQMVNQNQVSSAITRVPARTDVDLALGWQLSDQLQLALVGKNLSDNDEIDFFNGTRIARSAYLSLRYDF